MVEMEVKTGLMCKIKIEEMKDVERKEQRKLLSKLVICVISVSLLSGVGGKKDFDGVGVTELALTR